MAHAVEAMSLESMVRDSVRAESRCMSPRTMVLKRLRSSGDSLVLSKWLTTTMVVSPPMLSQNAAEWLVADGYGMCSWRSIGNLEYRRITSPPQ